MRRHRYIWPLFGLCFLAVLAGMGWITVLALDLDRNRLEADSQARFQQRVRLAIWRLDSAIQPLILQESSRPHYVYQAFYNARDAYTKNYTQIDENMVLIPSHLLFFESSWIRLHFQIEPDGQITSPEVPTGNGRDMMELRYNLGAKITNAVERLSDLREVLQQEALIPLLPETIPDPSPESLEMFSAGDDWLAANERNFANQQQAIKGRNYQARQRDSSSSLEPQMAGRQQGDRIEPSGPSRGPFRRLWVGPALVMARRVKFRQAEVVQGCWLDWPNIKPWLLSNISDLLDQADLVPVQGGKMDDSSAGTQLATLPVRLVTGQADPIEQPFWSPVRYALLFGWICVLLGGTAVAVVLAQAVSLSKRRGAFVSAVTHEMRTPLTTFRLYSEMLADGMIQDETKRSRYLHRLRSQADRLSHLVENVLAYARLTGPRSEAQLENLVASDFMDHVRDRLASRAEQGRLRLELDDQTESCQVRADSSAVEQILLNLVDNACKYASTGQAETVTLRLTQADGWVCFAVIDQGPGIPPDQAGGIFKAFGKSARQAAHSAPGIGLGLALSRRLARNMGGDLELDGSYKLGACFVLRLKRAEQTS